MTIQIFTSNGRLTFDVEAIEIADKYGYQYYIDDSLNNLDNKPIIQRTHIEDQTECDFEQIECPIWITEDKMKALTSSLGRDQNIDDILND